MLESFYPVCDPYLTPYQAYLMIILSGSTFGAIYEKEYYVFFIDIAYQMTIKNLMLYELKSSDKWINFIEICKFLLPNSGKQVEFRKEIITIIVKNYSDKDFDIYSIVTHSLIRYLNFEISKEQG